MSRRARKSGDEGETLIELIVSITILGIVAVAIGTGITLSVIVSDQNRKQTVANAYLHNDAEALQGSTAYQSCSPSLNYVTGFPSLFVTPSKFTLSQSNIQFWNGTGWSSACPDNGLQRVTLSLDSDDGRAHESIVVVVRQA